MTEKTALSSTDETVMQQDVNPGDILKIIEKHIKDRGGIIAILEGVVSPTRSHIRARQNFGVRIAEYHLRLVQLPPLNRNGFALGIVGDREG